MKIPQLLIIVFAFFLIACKNQIKIPPCSSFEKSQVLLVENFESKFVDSRNVEIFLPAGYNPESADKYKVLYMHDGQNVFNPKTSYTGIDWGVDEAIDSLMKAGKIKNTIVVAPWNSPKRFVEYMPKSPAEASEDPVFFKEMKKEYGFDGLYSDEYLKFLVEELKPFIDKTYNTSTKVEDTSIMGSSMGGLISLYAICKYPDVFGAAGCISTHWVVPVLGEAYIKTLPESLPSPENHKIYFDFGTEGHDAQYEPFQNEVDQMMIEKAYVTGSNWMTKKYQGASHSEKSWKERIHIPLQFLLN